MYKVALHLDNGMCVVTCVSGVYSGEYYTRVLSDLTDQVESKLCHHVVEVECCRMALGTDERRTVILHDGTRAHEAVAILDTPDTPPAPDEKQYDAPGYDVLARAPVSHMRELKRTAGWPKPSPVSPASPQPPGRAVTPERKREILNSKDSRYIVTLTGSRVLSPAGLRALLASNPFGGVE